ncbi:MAG: DMT family transporter [Clostridia bacterium]|nr:DMT family transporter [Clostridia bacterium]
MTEKVKKSKTLFSSFLLMLAAFIWGTAFVAQSKGLEQIGNFTFLALRSCLAVVFLTPVSLFIYKNNKKKIGDGPHGENKTFFSKRLILGGVLCGGSVCLASLVQQYGIILSGVGKSGFLTTLYILIVPLLGLLFKRKVKPILWFSIVLATCGMYFLCVTQAGGINIGDVLLIMCAFLFAVQIMIVDHFVETVDGVRLSLVQFAVSAVISTVGMFLFEEVDPVAIGDAWFSIFYAGVLSSGIAFTLQIVAQKNLNPTVASLLMSLESVFAALAGAFFGERLSVNEIFGCVLVFLAIILAQLPVESLFKRKSK